jgi:hypothetical protein
VKKIIPLFFLILSSCGYQGYYRYSCQDPESWESEDCNPPICKADGACSKDLIGYDWEVGNDE